MNRSKVHSKEYVFSVLVRVRGGLCRQRKMTGRKTGQGKGKFGKDRKKWKVPKGCTSPACPGKHHSCYYLFFEHANPSLKLSFLWPPKKRSTISGSFHQKHHSCYYLFLNTSTPPLSFSFMATEDDRQDREAFIFQPLTPTNRDGVGPGLHENYGSRVAAQDLRLHFFSWGGGAGDSASSTRDNSVACNP